MDSRRAFICAEHGLAIVYYLQSEVIPTLLKDGIQVTLLTDDSLRQKIEQRFGQPGLTVEGMRLSLVRKQASRWSELQWWLAFLRRVGGSHRMNTEAMDSYIDQVTVEESNRRRILLPFAKMFIALLRRSRAARRSLVQAQRLFTPELYADLFEASPPQLVVSSTPGWRMDRYLLREAHARKVATAATVIGWDNPSSYSLPGAPVDDIVCWSDIQRQELVDGSDWDAAHVHVTGMPTYDGYFSRRWQMSREDYFALHRLDQRRKLICFACSFVSFSPNLQVVEALARLVREDRLGYPSQLLVRLHPNHFLDVHLFVQEREQIHALAAANPHVRVVAPVPLGGSLGHYSGEDMPEKASMLAQADVFVTVYSTMVVEAAIHDRPIVSACLDAPLGWDTPRKYSLPLSAIGGWPTHDRFRRAEAGKVVYTETELEAAIRRYLDHPELDAQQRRTFIERELTTIDGSAGRRTGEELIRLVDRIRR